MLIQGQQLWPLLSLTVLICGDLFASVLAHALNMLHLHSICYILNNIRERVWM